MDVGPGRQLLRLLSVCLPCRLWPVVFHVCVCARARRPCACVLCWLAACLGGIPTGACAAGALNRSSVRLSASSSVSQATLLCYVLLLLERARGAAVCMHRTPGAGRVCSKELEQSLVVCGCAARLLPARCRRHQRPQRAAINAADVSLGHVCRCCRCCVARGMPVPSLLLERVCVRLFVITQRARVCCATQPERACVFAGRVCVRACRLHRIAVHVFCTAAHCGRVSACNAPPPMVGGLAAQTCAASWSQAAAAAARCWPWQRGAWECGVRHIWVVFVARMQQAAMVAHDRCGHLSSPRFICSTQSAPPRACRCCCPSGGARSIGQGPGARALAAPPQASPSARRVYSVGCLWAVRVCCACLYITLALCTLFTHNAPRVGRARCVAAHVSLRHVFVCMCAWVCVLCCPVVAKRRPSAHGRDRRVHFVARQRALLLVRSSYGVVAC